MMNTEKINYYWKEAFHIWLRNSEATTVQEEFAKLIIGKVLAIIAGSWDENEALNRVNEEFL